MNNVLSVPLAKLDVQGVEFDCMPYIHTVDVKRNVFISTTMAIARCLLLVLCDKGPESWIE